MREIVNKDIPDLIYLDIFPEMLIGHLYNQTKYIKTYHKHAGKYEVVDDEKSTFIDERMLISSLYDIQ